MTEQTRTVTVERDFAYPPEKLWRALTQPHLIEEWLMKNDFKLGVGEKFQLRMDAQQGWNGVIDCEVKEIEPNKSLTYTWATMGTATVVTFTLTPTANGAHLRVEQSGFAANAAQAYAGATYGWNNFLGKLEQLLARTE
ncbi:MAG TPA: SRPBCC domain-containing protein [Rhizomicrobium sp.]|nr:SRPBCC domain-containing protein [Rhizomicrobium sp.]